METRQTGWVIILIMMFSAVTLTVVALLSDVPDDERWILSFMVPVMLIPALLFYQLTVRIDRTYLQISFGIGLIRKKWKLSDIAKASVVRNNFLHGWGIHFTTNTTVYNVSGFDAIELTLTGRKRKIRIGTNEPEKLAGMINRFVAESKDHK